MGCAHEKHSLLTLLFLYFFCWVSIILFICSSSYWSHHYFLYILSIQDFLSFSLSLSLDRIFYLLKWMRKTMHLSNVEKIKYAFKIVFSAVSPNQVFPNKIKTIWEKPLPFSSKPDQITKQWELQAILKLIRFCFPPYNWILIRIGVQSIFLRPLHLIIIYKAGVDIIGHIPYSAIQSKWILFQSLKDSLRWAWLDCTFPLIFICTDVCKQHNAEIKKMLCCTKWFSRNSKIIQIYFQGNIHSPYEILNHV